MKMKTGVLYYLFLILILTLSTFGASFSLLRNLENDSSEIAEHIPEFSIEDGSMTSENESFTYQTDSMLFFFDPHHNIGAEELDTNVDRLPASIGVGLFEEEIMVNFDGIARSIPYDQFNQTIRLTPDRLRRLLTDFGFFSPVMMVAIFVSLYIATFLTSLLDFLILALFANILATLLRSGLRFSQVFKVSLLSATIPSIVLGITNILQWHSPYYYEMRVTFSLILFALSIFEMKRKTKKDESKKE